METYYNMNVIGYYLGVLKKLELQQQEERVKLNKLIAEIALLRAEQEKGND